VAALRPFRTDAQGMSMLRECVLSLMEAARVAIEDRVSPCRLCRVERFDRPNRIASSNFAKSGKNHGKNKCRSRAKNT